MSKWKGNTLPWVTDRAYVAFGIIEWTEVELSIIGPMQDYSVYIYLILHEPLPLQNSMVQQLFPQNLVNAIHNAIWANIQSESNGAWLSMCL